MQAVGCGNVGSYHTTPLPSPHGACTMNTIKKSASTNFIVAVQLGKYKSVGCVLDPATGEYRRSARPHGRAHSSRKCASRLWDPLRRRRDAVARARAGVLATAPGEAADGTHLH